VSAALTIPLLLLASVYDDTFAEGNAAYLDGDYRGAVAAYRQLVTSNVEDAAVFFNLANAHYRLGQLPEAIVNYERAIYLDPGLERAADNLDTAVGQTERKLPRPLPPAWEQSLLVWHYNLSLRVTLTAAITLWFGFWIALGARLWWRRPALTYPAVALGVLAAAFLGSAWAKHRPSPLAVTAEEVVPVRFGMSENEQVHFELFAGDRVHVETERGEWARVTTYTGDRGWAKRDALLRVGPPYTTATGNGETPEANAS